MARKRFKLTRKQSKRSFRKGTRVHRKNSMNGMIGPMRGGIRL